MAPPETTGGLPVGPGWFLGVRGIARDDINEVSDVARSVATSTRRCRDLVDPFRVRMRPNDDRIGPNLEPDGASHKCEKSDSPGIST